LSRKVNIHVFWFYCEPTGFVFILFCQLRKLQLLEAVCLSRGIYRDSVIICPVLHAGFKLRLHGRLICVSGFSTGVHASSLFWRVLVCNYLPRWLGSRVVSVLDSGAEGPGFTSQPRRCRVTVLGKLFTPIVPPFTKQQN